MTLDYFKVSGTDYALGLAAESEAARRTGITGMASAFKEFAGCGEIDLEATRVEGGLKVSGKLRWASNLCEDPVIVPAAKTAEGVQLLFALGAETEGVTLGSSLALLGLNATACAWVSFEDVFIPGAQILSHDFLTLWHRCAQPS